METWCIVGLILYNVILGMIYWNTDLPEGLP
jgi:hypothetical protein